VGKVWEVENFNVQEGEKFENFGLNFELKMGSGILQCAAGGKIWRILG